MTCRLRDATSDGHLWDYPARAGDLCGCGEMVISKTVETGTGDGLSVVSWEAVPSEQHPGSEVDG